MEVCYALLHGVSPSVVPKPYIRFFEAVKSANSRFESKIRLPDDRHTESKQARVAPRYQQGNPLPVLGPCCFQVCHEIEIEERKELKIHTQSLLQYIFSRGKFGIKYACCELIVYPTLYQTSCSPEINIAVKSISILLKRKGCVLQLSVAFMHTF